MAYGKHIAARAEADRLRQLSAEKIESEEDASTVPAAASQAPAAVAASAQRPSTGFRPSGQSSGGFRPGRATSRDQVQNSQESQSQKPTFGGLAIEDGIPTVQVVRRLLELAAVERWPQTRVDHLERLAHDEPGAVWEQISDAWEALSERRRVAALPRDTAQITFRIIQADGQVRPSTPTGPRAKTMALLHGLDLVRLPANRAPFPAEVLAEVQAEQRRLRQAAQAQAQTQVPAQETSPANPVHPPIASQDSQPVDAPAPAESAPSGRWVRQARR